MPECSQVLYIVKALYRHRNMIRVLVLYFRLRFPQLGPHEVAFSSTLPEIPI